MGAENSNLQSVESLNITLVDLESKMFTIERIEHHHERLIRNNDSVYVADVAINSRRDVALIAGPILGLIGTRFARILVETKSGAEITFFVFCVTDSSGCLLFSHSVSLICESCCPAVMTLKNLSPNSEYVIYLGGLDSAYSLIKSARFRTLDESLAMLSVQFTRGNQICNPDKIQSYRLGTFQNQSEEVRESPSETSRLFVHCGDFVSIENNLRQQVRALFDYICREDIHEEVLRRGLEDLHDNTAVVYRSALCSKDFEEITRQCGCIMIGASGETALQYLSMLSAHYTVDSSTDTLALVDMHNECVSLLTTIVSHVFRKVNWMYMRQLWDEDIEGFRLKLNLIDDKLTQLLVVKKRIHAKNALLFTLKSNTGLHIHDALPVIMSDSNTLEQLERRLTDAIAIESLCMERFANGTCLEVCSLLIVVLDVSWGPLFGNDFLSFSKGYISTELHQTVFDQLINALSSSSGGTLSTAMCVSSSRIVPLTWICDLKDSVYHQVKFKRCTEKHPCDSHLLNEDLNKLWALLNDWQELSDSRTALFVEPFETLSFGTIVSRNSGTQKDTKLCSKFLRIPALQMISDRVQRHTPQSSYCANANAHDNSNDLESFMCVVNDDKPFQNISCKDLVVFGPVVGLVTAASANILIEFDQSCHVTMYCVDQLTTEEFSIDRWCVKDVPCVFHFRNLKASSTYRIIHSGQDSLRTFTTHQSYVSEWALSNEHALDFSVFINSVGKQQSHVEEALVDEVFNEYWNDIDLAIHFVSSSFWMDCVEQLRYLLNAAEKESFVDEDAEADFLRTASSILKSANRRYFNFSAQRGYTHGNYFSVPMLFDVKSLLSGDWTKYSLTKFFQLMRETTTSYHRLHWLAHPDCSGSEPQSIVMGDGAVLLFEIQPLFNFNENRLGIRLNENQLYSLSNELSKFGNRTNAKTLSTLIVLCPVVLLHSDTCNDTGNTMESPERYHVCLKDLEKILEILFSWLSESKYKRNVLLLTGDLSEKTSKIRVTKKSASKAQSSSEPYLYQINAGYCHDCSDNFPGNFQNSVLVTDSAEYVIDTHVLGDESFNCTSGLKVKFDLVSSSPAKDTSEHGLAIRSLCQEKRVLFETPMCNRKRFLASADVWRKNEIISALRVFSLEEVSSEGSAALVIHKINCALKRTLLKENAVLSRFFHTVTINHGLFGNSSELKMEMKVVAMFKQIFVLLSCDSQILCKAPTGLCVRLVADFMTSHEEFDVEKRSHFASKVMSDFAFFSKVFRMCLSLQLCLTYLAQP